MNVFKRSKLNLTWIESFPKPDVFSEYNFFVELQGHRDEVRLRNAFNQLKKKTSSLSVLAAASNLVSSSAAAVVSDGTRVSVSCAETIEDILHQVSISALSNAVVGEDPVLQDFEESECELTAGTAEARPVM